MKALVQCPVCEGPIRPWAAVHDRHYGNPGLFSLSECQTCSARFMNPMPDEHELDGFYPRDYYSFGVETPTSPPSGVRSKLQRALLPRGTKEPKFTACGRMLDLGCGSGWMVAEYARKGWAAVGVDPSEAAAASGRAQGIDIRVGSLGSQQFESATFDYIRANHSFEHIGDPHGTLAEIHRLLRPGGTIFLGVPDTNGLMARLFRREWYFLGAPVHTINYSRRNLPELLRRHGFEVDSVRPNSNHGSTIGSLKSWCVSKGWSHTRLDSGLMSFAPTILVGFWMAKLLDVLGQGDCVEVVARKGLDPVSCER